MKKIDELISKITPIANETPYVSVYPLVVETLGEKVARFMLEIYEGVVVLADGNFKRSFDRGADLQARGTLNMLKWMKAFRVVFIEAE